MAPCFSLAQTTKTQPGNLFIGAIFYTSEGATAGGKGREEGSAPPGMSTFNPHDRVVSQCVTLPSYP